MKSIFLFCNYGIAYTTILKLYKQNITTIDIVNNTECLDHILGTNSKKAYEIKKKIFDVLNSKENYSLYDLIPYGLSKSIVALLINNHVTFSEINESLLNKPFISNSTYNKIIKSYNDFLFNIDIKHNLNEQELKSMIKTFYKYEVFSIEELLKLCEQKKVDNNNIMYLIHNLLKNKILMKKDNGYCLMKPRLEEIVCKIPIKNNHRDILVKKLSGNTLESIGTQYNVTRERIRQIIKKEMDKFPITYEEEKYKKLFTTYHFDCELFCELFQENTMVYYFLKEKYKLGEQEPSELIENNEVSNRQLEVLKRRYNLVYFCGENIVVNRSNLLLAILKNNNNFVEYDELVNQYNDLIITNNLSLDLLSETDFRNVDRVLSSSVNVLCGFGRYYRYYNVEELDDDDILELQEMLNVDVGDYSAEFFYQNNLELMNRIDIRNGYELHNLLRKKIGNFNNKIIYNRMPDILIDCNNKHEFILNQIQELSPIKLEDFADYMYKNYGHKTNSFTALIQSDFNEFLTNGIIISNSNKFTPEQFNILRSKLNADIYSIMTIKKMMTELFNVNDFKLLNNLNFSKLGYKIRGNYIMKSEITNLEAYLRNIILTTDYYEVNHEMKQIGSTFTSYIYKFIYNLNLFKIGNDKYITIKKLNDLNITKKQIKEFIDKLNNNIIDNNYFNLYTLKKTLDMNFCDYNFPDCFYETLISTIPSVKTFRMKNNLLFIKTDKNATREAFINSFINKNKTYISEIKKDILNTYNIELEEYYIRQFVNRKKYYFDTSTDCIYLNKDIYEKEIDDFDILQFID